MKLIRTLLIGVAALFGSVNAATVTISPGFGGGIKVTTEDVQTTYSMSVGTFSEGLFTMFGTTVSQKAVNAGIGGEFAGVGPASVNDQMIAIQITNGDAFAILMTTATFPSDTSSALASSTANVFTEANVTLVSSSNGTSFTSPTNLNLVAVPEPSVAILGALGALGLIRRRR